MSEVRPQLSQAMDMVVSRGGVPGVAVPVDSNGGRRWGSSVWW
jgi:hypothetical protein